MLGRRAAAGIASVVVAVTGGTALAATHGSSKAPSSKMPSSKSHAVVMTRSVRPAAARTGHHCSHQRQSASYASDL
jgi:hypothetical protein